MRPIHTWRAAGTLAVLALALPASAAAAPSVHSVVAKTGNAGVTFLTDPTGAALTNTQTRYTVSDAGYAVGFAETNGVTVDGVIDYSVLPAEYRAPMTAEEKRTYAPAETGVQPHATCSAVAVLARGETILAWQRNAANEPSYDYVPWQKTTAGLGDDPRTWLSVVRTATGVDLSTSTTAAEFRTACERIGGTYVAADTATAIAGTLISNATAPLQTQITRLQSDVSTLRRAVQVARDAQRLAETTYQSFFTKPIELTLAAKRFQPRDGVALVTGAPTDPVRVSLEVTRRQARRLGLSDTVLVETLGEIDANGAALLTLKPDAETAALLERWLTPPKPKARRGARRARARAAKKRSIAVTVNAVSGGNADSARATLVR